MAETTPPSPTAVDRSLDETRDRPARRKRPAPVTLVAVLALAVSAYSLFWGVVGVRGHEETQAVEAVLYLVLGVATLVASVGAFRMRPWGWATFMTWNVVGLTHQVLRYFFFDDPNYLDLAINTFVVLALSPIEVQIAFGLRHTENVQLGRPTRNPVDSH